MSPFPTRRPDLQQQDAAVAEMNRQAAEQDFIAQQQKEQARMQQMQEEQARDAARAQKAALANAKRQGVKIAPDATGAETIQRHPDGQPVYEAGFVGEPQINDKGGAVAYRDARGRRYDVPFDAIRSEPDPTGETFYSFDVTGPDGQKQTMRQPAGTKPLFRVDPGTGSRIVDVTDPTTGSVQPRVVGVDPLVANKAAIENRKNAAQLAQNERSGAAEELRLQLAQKDTLLQPVRQKLREAQEAADKLAKEKSTYEQAADGYYAVTSLGDGVEPMRRKVDSPQEIAKADAWVKNRTMTEKALAEAKAAHDPAAAEIQAMQERRDALALETLKENRRAAAEIRRMEEAAKAGRDVTMPDWQQRAESLTRDAKLDDLAAIADLAALGDPLAGDVERAAMPEAAASINRMMSELWSGTVNAGRDLLNAGITGGNITLEKAIANAPGMANRTGKPATTDEARRIAAKSLGITDPASVEVTPNPLGHLELRYGNDEFASYEPDRNRITIMQTAGGLHERAADLIAKADKDGVPVYLSNTYPNKAEQPFTAAELRDLLVQGVDAVRSADSQDTAEAALAQVGLAPNDIRGMVRSGKLSVQDGRMMLDKFHGVEAVNYSRLAIEQELGRVLATSKTAKADWEAGNKAAVINRVMDGVASKATSGVVVDRGILEQRRQELLSQHVQEGAASKVGGFFKELIMPMIGIGGQAVAYVPQKLAKWTGYETEAGRLSEQQFEDWQKRTGSFVHKMMSRDDVTNSLGELRSWAQTANPGDAPPDDLAEKIAGIAYDGYHELTDDAAKALNTSRDTFNVNRDPMLRAALDRYLRTADPAAFDQLSSLLMLDGQDRKTQAEVSAYISAPRVASFGDVIGRAKGLNIDLTPDAAGKLVGISRVLARTDDPKAQQKLIADAGKIMGLEGQEAAETLVRLTADETDDPDSAFGLLKGGFVAGRQELATEALFTGMEAGMAWVTAGAATPEIIAERAARQGIKTGIRAAIRRNAQAAFTKLADSSTAFAKTAAALGKARQTVGTGLANMGEAFAKAGIKPATFGQPLTRADKVRNAAVQVGKNAAAAAPMETLEEGVAAIGEPDPNAASIGEQMLMGAAGGLVLTPMFAGAAAVGQAWKNRGAGAEWEAKKTGYIDELNRRMESVPGFKPLTVADFDAWQGLQDNPAQAQARQAMLDAMRGHEAAVTEWFNANAGNPQAPLSPAVLAAQANVERAGKELELATSSAFMAMDELRGIPEAERPLYTAAAKAATGARDFTEAEAKALMAQGGNNAVVFQQAQAMPGNVAAPSQRGISAPAVSNVAPGVYRLPAGVRVDVPPALLDSLVQKAPTMVDLLRQPANQTPAVQAVVAKADAKKQAMPKAPKGKKRIANVTPATQTPAPEVAAPVSEVGKTAVVPTAEVAGSEPAQRAATEGATTNAPTPTPTKQDAGPLPVGKGNTTGTPAKQPANPTPAPVTAAPERSDAELSPTEFKERAKSKTDPSIWSPAVAEFEHRSKIAQAIKDGLPFSVEAARAYGIKVPPQNAPAGPKAATGQTLPAKAIEKVTREAIGRIAAKSPRIKALLKESKKASRYPTGGMWLEPDGTVMYHVPTIVKQLESIGVTDNATAGKRVEALLDEEIRHSANMEAARRLFAGEQAAGRVLRGMSFETWRDAWYGDIWNSHFTDAMRQAVQEAYGDTLPEADWMRAMEGLRMLDQLRATGSITEAVLLALDAILESLREFLDLVTAGGKKVVEAEIMAIREVLAEYGYEGGTVKPDAKKKPAKPKAQKQETSKRADSAPEMSTSQQKLPILTVSDATSIKVASDPVDLLSRANAKGMVKISETSFNNAQTGEPQKNITFEFRTAEGMRRVTFRDDGPRDPARVAAGKQPAYRFSPVLDQNSQAIPPATTQTADVQDQTKAQRQRQTQEVLTPANPETAPTQGAVDGLPPIEKAPPGSPELAKPTIAADKHWLFDTQAGDVAGMTEGRNVFIVAHFTKLKDAKDALAQINQGKDGPARIEAWLAKPKKEGGKVVSKWAVFIPNVTQDFVDEFNAIKAKDQAANAPKQAPLPAPEIATLRNALRQLRRWKQDEGFGSGYEQAIDNYERGTWTLQDSRPPAETLAALEAAVVSARQFWIVQNTQYIEAQNAELARALAANAAVADVLNNPRNDAQNLRIYLLDRIKEALVNDLRAKLDSDPRFGLFYDFTQGRIADNAWLDMMVARVKEQLGAPAASQPSFKVGDRVQANEGTGKIAELRGGQAKLTLDNGTMSLWIPVDRLQAAAPVSTPAAQVPGAVAEAYQSQPGDNYPYPWKGVAYTNEGGRLAVDRGGPDEQTAKQLALELLAQEWNARESRRQASAAQTAKKPAEPSREEWQKTYAKFKRALAKAVKAKDYAEIIKQADAFQKHYEADGNGGFPDDWSTWERHKSDAEMQLARQGSATNPLVVPILKPVTPPRPAERADDAYANAQAATRAALGGLFSAPVRRAIPQLEVPRERFDAIRTAAEAILEANIRTPEAFARFMDDTFPGGKARPYSEAIWDMLGIVDKSLRGSHDWTRIYGDIEQPLPDVQEPAIDETPDIAMAEKGGERRLTGPEAFGQENVIRLGGKNRARFLPAVWQMFQDTYRAIGHQYDAAEQLLAEGTLWDVVLDPATGQPIAFNIAKISAEHGYKAVAFGSDGGSTGKLAVRGIIARFNKDGYWAELSDAPAHIARKTGIPVLPAEFAGALLGKPVTVLDESTYERWITGLPEPHIKTIFGKPWNSPQQNPSANKSTNSERGETPAPTSQSGKNLEKPSSQSQWAGNSASQTNQPDETPAQPRQPDQPGIRPIGDVADAPEQTGQAGSTGRDNQRPQIQPDNLPPAGDSGNTGEVGVSDVRQGGGNLPQEQQSTRGQEPSNDGPAASDGGEGSGMAGGERTPHHSPGRDNYQLTDPESIVGGGPKARFQKNKAALELLDILETENREPTTAELNTLAAYTGWGALGQELFQGSFENYAGTPEWREEAMWLRDRLGKDDWTSAQDSILNAHYTDPPTFMAMWDMIRRMGFTGGRVLEPSEGIGNAWSLMPRDLMANSQLTGIEMDPTTAAIAKMLHPKVNHRTMPYQKSTTSDNFYDVILGNWPFSNNDKPADRRWDHLEATVHNFFFIKALAQVRPGGLVVGITSTGTMDAKSSRIRKYLAARGELVAAFRLPSGAFGKYAGTKVVTDLIILRKREKELETDAADQGWVNSVEHPEFDFNINEYYLKNPSHVLGKLAFGHGTTSGRPGMIVERSADYDQVLARLPERLPEGAFLPWNGDDMRDRVINNTTKESRQNTVVEQSGELYTVNGESLTPLDAETRWKTKTQKTNDKRLAEARALIALRDAFTSLMRAYQSQQDATAPRAALKTAYEAFRSAHGNLSDSFMLDKFEKAGDPYALDLRALVELRDGIETPRAIMERDILRAPKLDTKGNIADAYAAQRANSPVFDAEEVAKLAGVTSQDVIDFLSRTGTVFKTPTGVWEPGEIYLSGNVRRKLREAEAAKAEGVEGMDANIEALRKIVPADVPYYAITTQMGVAWIPLSDYTQFIQEKLNGRPQDIRVSKVSGGYNVRIEGRTADSTEARNTYNVVDDRGEDHLTPSRIFQAAMNGTALEVKVEGPKDANGNKTIYVDEALTKRAMALRDRIRNEFARWVWEDEARAARLSYEYNEAMNSVVNAKFDGGHLTMPGLALSLGKGSFDLRKHQLDAIWRGIVNRKGVYAHEVGTGKTFTMAGIAIEGKRQGRHRKPLLFAHNANSAAVAADFRRAYPGARILYLDSLSPSERDLRLRQIASDDWDAVIVPHSLIDRFGLKADTLYALARGELDALESEFWEAAGEIGITRGSLDLNDSKRVSIAINNARGADKNLKRTAKELASARRRIVTRIEKQISQFSKPGTVFFEDMGIDAIMVDEAHVFKKIALATRKQIKGLNKTESGKGFQLGLLTDYLKRENNGNGVHLFTGTPVTNTLNEVFNMMRFVMHDEMSEQSIENFDDWYNSYAKGVTDIEPTSGGTWEAVERLRAFLNIPELARLAGQVFDVVRAKDMPEFLPRPSEDGFIPEGQEPIGRPSKAVRPVVIEPPPIQKRVMSWIRQRFAVYRDLPNRIRGMLKKMGGDAPNLMDIDGKNAALDPRLVDPSAQDDPNSKVNTAISRVLEHYSEHPNATQMVFLERGANDFTTAEVTIYGPEGPIYDNDGNKQTRKETRKQFNILRDMVEKLVAQGVKPEEIAVFHNLSLLPLPDGREDVLKKVRRVSAATPKDEIAAMMNRGEIRIAFGGTETMGTGVNAQTWLRAMHHLDVPWMPGELEQRNGRGHRQGNRWNTVFEYRYTMEGTHDGKMWSTLLNKVRFIERFTEMLQGRGLERTLEGEGADASEADDEASASDFEQMFSKAAGDPRILLRVKMERDLEKLRNDKQIHYGFIEQARRKAEQLENDIPRQEATASRLEADFNQFKTGTAGGFSATLRDKTFTERAEFDEAMKRLPTFRDRTKVGTFAGFDIYIVPTIVGQSFELVGPNTGTRDGYMFNTASAASMEGVLRGLGKRAANLRDGVEKSRADVAKLRAKMNEPFPAEKTLADQEKAYEVLVREIVASPTPAPGWLRYGAPAGSLIYLRENGRLIPKDVMAHRWDANGYWILVDMNGEMTPVRYTDAFTDEGRAMFEEQEFTEPPQITVNQDSEAGGQSYPGVEQSLMDEFGSRLVIDNGQVLRVPRWNIPPPTVENGYYDRPAPSASEFIPNTVADIHQLMRDAGERRPETWEFAAPGELPSFDDGLYEPRDTWRMFAPGGWIIGEGDSPNQAFMNAANHDQNGDQIREIIRFAVRRGSSKPTVRNDPTRLLDVPQMQRGLFRRREKLRSLIEKTQKRLDDLEDDPPVTGADYRNGILSERLNNLEKELGTVEGLLMQAYTSGEEMRLSSAPAPTMPRDRAEAIVRNLTPKEQAGKLNPKERAALEEARARLEQDDNGFDPGGNVPRQPAGPRSGGPMRSLWRIPDQAISSADTSINQGQLPASFKRIAWQKGTVNADIGGGRFDNATDMLAGLGVENVIYDPFNRSQEHNRAAVAKIAGGKADTATVNNVLNVIQEPASRSLVIQQAADAVGADGTAYFLIYEGDGSGQGKVTTKGWQENRKAESYAAEVGQVFGSVVRKGNLLIATQAKPLSEAPLASAPVSQSQTLRQPQITAQNAWALMLAPSAKSGIATDYIDGLKVSLANANTLAADRAVSTAIRQKARQDAEQLQTLIPEEEAAWQRIRQQYTPQQLKQIHDDATAYTVPVSELQADLDNLLADFPDAATRPAWATAQIESLQSEISGGTLASSPARKPNRATQAMRDIIEALPPPHREVLRDLLVNGMSIADAATKHNLSETAVGNILRRGEAHIRLMLDRAPTKPTVQVQDGIVKATDGRPDLAMSGNAAVAAVDQRRMTPEEVTHAEMQELATRLFDVAPAEAESLVVRWMDSGTTVLSTDGMPDSIKAIVADAQARNAAEMMMTAAAKMLVARKTLEGGNSTQLARLIYLYRNTGTEQARALGMRRDPFDTPEERAAMYLSEALLTPPDAIKNELRRNPANRDRILAAWAKRADEIKAEMLAHGIDLDATFADHAEEQKLVEETIPEPVKPALARAPKKTRQLVKAIMQGMTPAEAIRAAGLTAKAAFRAYQEFRASLNQTGTEAAQAMRDQLLRSAPAPGADFAANLGLPDLTEAEWLDAVQNNKPLRKTPETEKLKQHREKAKKAGTLDLKNSNSTRKAIRAIEERKSNAFEKISEFWRASILSGPQTHVVNLVSGLTYGAYEASFKKLAAGVQGDIARMFGAKPDAASLADIPAMIAASLPSIKLAFLDGIAAWKSETRAFENYALQLRDDNGELFKEQFNPALKGKLGAVMRGISFRLMGAADEFVKSFFTRIEVAAQARQIARNEGKTGHELAKAIQELMEPGSLAWERALGQAKKITFQTEIGSGSAAIDAIDGLAQLISRTKKGDFGKPLKGLAHFTFPFVDTPTNIFKAGVTMSPVGGLLALVDMIRAYNRYRKGNAEEAAKIYNAARALDDLTNQIVAWGFILGLSHLVKPGDDEDETPYITGTIPWRSTSPGERELAYRTAPPQSIRIGDRWISYKRLDPFASALAFTVDAIKEFQSGKPIDEVWGRIALGMGRNMQDKTFLQGISDVVNAVQDPERFGTKWATNIATGFIPNLIRQPIRTADDVFRETDLPNDLGFWDALGRRMGYGIYPQGAMPAITVWGEPARKDTGTGGPNTDWMLRLLSPADMRAANVDMLDVALLRYNATHQDGDPRALFGVTAPSRELQRTIGGQVVKISLDDAEYEDFIAKAGKAARQAIGTTYDGRDLTEADVDRIKDILSRAHETFRNAAFVQAVQKRGGLNALANTTK